MAFKATSRIRVMILSLLMATIIWLFNELNKDGYTLQVRYPLDLAYNDSVYVPLTPVPKTVVATLTGNGWSLLRKTISFAVPPVVYQITNPLATRTIDTQLLTNTMNRQVQDVKINHIVADTNILDFDERMQKTVVLQVDSVHINMASRFVISSLINLTPRFIQFDGPAVLVRDIADTIVVRLPQKNIHGNFDEEQNIIYPQSPLLKVSHDKVFISFEVAELLQPTTKSKDNKK